MKIKPALLLTLLVLAIGLSGCGQIVTTPEAPTATPTPTGPTMGDRLINNPGGFSFLSIPDYTLQADGAAVMMLAPEADVNEGPAIVLMGAVDETLTGLTAADELPMFIEGTPFEMGEIKVITLNGLDGATVELTGSAESGGLVGRAAVLVPAPNRAFLMMGVAPAERWDELAVYFEAVLGSVAFFDPAAGSTP